ncbi:hypothetical protein BH23PAT1_BH23PAT1_1080 [soil metagenome]
MKSLFRRVRRKSKQLINKLTDNFLSLKEWQKFTVLALAILIVSFGGYKAAVSQSAAAESKFYRSEIQNISESINDVHKMIGDRHSLLATDQLPDYGKSMDALITSCNKINKRYSEKNETEGAQKEAENAAKLCEDLRAVAIYQKNLYGQLETLLYIDTRQLPAPDDPKTELAVRNIATNLNQMRSNLRQLDTSKVNDPSLVETNKIISQLIDQAGDVQKDMSPEDYNRFVNRIDKVKADFMIRRGYFWLNTVQINRLESVLEQLLLSYES